MLVLTAVNSFALVVDQYATSPSLSKQHAAATIMEPRAVASSRTLPAFVGSLLADEASNIVFPDDLGPSLKKKPEAPLVRKLRDAQASLLALSESGRNTLVTSVTPAIEKSLKEDIAPAVERTGLY